MTSDPLTPRAAGRDSGETERDEARAEVEGLKAEVERLQALEAGEVQR